MAHGPNKNRIKQEYGIFELMASEEDELKFYLSLHRVHYIPDVQLKVWCQEQKQAYTEGNYWEWMYAIPEVARAWKRKKMPNHYMAKELTPEQREAKSIRELIKRGIRIGKPFSLEQYLKNKAIRATKIPKQFSTVQEKLIKKEFVKKALLQLEKITKRGIHIINIVTGEHHQVKKTSEAMLITGAKSAAIRGAAIRGQTVKKKFIIKINK